MLSGFLAVRCFIGLCVSWFRIAAELRALLSGFLVSVQHGRRQLLYGDVPAGGELLGAVRCVDPPSVSLRLNALAIPTFKWATGRFTQP
jgi:hypothetical protein